ncbi:MAG: divalent-cation tolerance protein CutA [Verrucomicrobiales bacterium]|nr:divalent-cation tolerance protein CutA [Verrucomicrobiales bacterium]|tara:strand:+ start:502 stop:834 length:333 start_codon:yes stop_codon:yes gene_type:complete
MNKAKFEYYVVLVTAPDIDVARNVAKAVLEQKKAACANIVPQIESHYWWEGKLESSNEVLIVFKTTEKALHQLEHVVREEHPYDTPEIVCTEITRGNDRYLNWLSDSVNA